VAGGDVVDIREKGYEDAGRFQGSITRGLGWVQGVIGLQYRASRISHKLFQSELA
jgi:hypothetical protein